MRRMLPNRFFISLLMLAVAPPMATAQDSADWSAARYLPPDIAVVVQAKDLGDRWNAIAQSATFEKIFQLPRVKRELAAGKLQKLQAGRAFIEGILGAPIEDFAQKWSQNGVVLAWREKQEFAVLFRPPPDEAKRLAKTLQEFSAAAALGNARDGKPQLFATKYRALDAFGIDTARIGFCKDWVVVSSSSELGKAILDRMLGDELPALAEQEWFAQAHQFARSLTNDHPPTLTAIADLETLRQRQQISNQRGVDPGAELLVGGIQDALSTAASLVATVNLLDDSLQIQIGTPCAAATDELRKYFFGHEQISAAPTPLDLPNQIASARWYRDLGLFWKMTPQLIRDENALAGIAKAESDISTLLGGMVTVSDVFQFIGPQLEFVAVQPMISGDAPPSIQVPAFGIIGNLRDVEKAQPALRLAFQQVVSFANLNASSRMYPPLEVMAEKGEGKTFVTASYFAMSRSEMSDQPGADVYKNFSPTLGFHGDRFVLTSHRMLAEQMLDAMAHVPNPNVSQGLIDNTIVEIRPRELAKAGDLNRDPLIAQQMLNSGKSHEDAEADVDTALELIRQFESAQLRLRASANAIVVVINANWAAVNEPLSKESP